MVSTVRYRTFKDLRLSRRSALVFMFILAGGLAIAAKLHPAWVLVAYFSLYLVLGLVESVVLAGRYFKEKRAAARASDDDDDEEDDEEDDVDQQEVL
jgi:CDP-diacylglycerol--serine O-phosphatidyltransferase